MKIVADVPNKPGLPNTMRQPKYLALNFPVVNNRNNSSENSTESKVSQI